MQEARDISVLAGGVDFSDILQRVISMMIDTDTALLGFLNC